MFDRVVGRLRRRRGRLGFGFRGFGFRFRHGRLERVLGALLPVLDSFDAAIQVDAGTATVENLLGGVRSTHNLLMDILAKEGLEAIPTFEEPFNPEIHEAVVTSGDGSRLVVSDEMRRGYRLRGKVIRAALVGLEGRD